MTPPEFWYIQRLSLIERLPDGALDRLKQEARLQRWGHNAPLTEAYREPDEVHLVVEGNVEVHAEATARRALKLTPGALFGALHSPDDPQLQQAALIAHDPVTLATLGCERFEELALAYAPLARFRGRALPLTARKSLELPLSMLLYTSPIVRLSRVLLYLAEDGAAEQRDDKQPGRPIWLKLPTRPGPLGALIGLDIEAMSPALERVRRSGALVSQRGRRGFLLRDKAPLRRLAEGLPLL